jgi:glycosyltransferase involved in cell wall biosynthesis
LHLFDFIESLNMHILFLTHYFPPEVNAPASRTFEHARLWRKAGHRVTIVTGVPNHPAGHIYPSYRNKLWQKETVEGVEVIRLWTYLSPNEGFLKRSLNFVTYLIAATLAAPFLDRPDIVVSTSPQFFCGLAGFTVSRIKRRPWVLEIRDLWPETILTVGAMKKGLAVKLLEALADWSYRKADRVVALTNAFKTHIIARGAKPEHVTVIKNGADLSEFGGSQDTAPFKREHGLEGKFVAAYVGTHGMCHRLDTVLEAASRLKQREDIAFLMVGGGAERARLLALKDSMDLPNLSMLEQLPKPAMPLVLTAADVSLVLLMKDDLFKTVLPSKMFEAMAMECPIVLGVEGEAKALLEEAGAGIAIAPENAEQLAAAVVQLADNAELRVRLGRQGAEYVREHYDRAKLAARYLDLLEVTATANRSRKQAVVPALRNEASS